MLGVIVEVSLKVLPRRRSRGHAALRHEAGRGAGGPARLGRQAAAARCQRLVERQPDRAPARRAGRGRRRGSAARRRSRSTRRPPARSGSPCATTPIPSSSPPPRRSSIRTRRSGACRCRRPRPCSASPATSSSNGTAASAGSARALPAALVRDAAAAAGGHATLFRGTDKSAGVFAPLVAAAAPDPRAAQARLRSERHLQSRPPLPRPLSDDLACRPTSLPNSHDARGHRGRRDPAQVRALRLLHRHLPDLPAARRRARRPARPHLPDEAGARRRMRRRARHSCTSTAA